MIGIVYDQGTGSPCVELFHKVGLQSLTQVVRLSDKSHQVFILLKVGDKSEALSRDAFVKGISGYGHSSRMLDFVFHRMFL